MSLYASRVALIHRCTIERLTLVSDGGGGHTETWALAEADVPCLAWFERSDLDVQADKPTVTDERRVVVPLGTDVRSGDRLANVSHRGSTIFAGPLPVDTVGRHTDHLLLFVREVT